MTGGILSSCWQRIDMLSVHKESTTRATSRYSSMTYQLIKIPATNLHVASVLIQALGETFGIRFATPWTPVIVLITVLGGLGSHSVVRLLSLCSFRAGAATEESPNSMSDGRAYGNTTWGQISVFLSVPKYSRRGLTLRWKPSGRTDQGFVVVVRLQWEHRVSGHFRLDRRRCLMDD